MDQIQWKRTERTLYVPFETVKPGMKPGGLLRNEFTATGSKIHT